MHTDTRRSVRELNDAFRQSHEGGRVVLSAAVATLQARVISEVIDAVRVFDRFDEDNDPHDEHDFGSLCVSGEHFFWKIDYYDRSLGAHSPDAGDPAATTRVLTIMLASDY